MNLVVRAIWAIWWLGAAAIPIAQHRLYENYRQAIGCPKVGYCYSPGFELLSGMETLAVGSAFVLWPLCAFHLLLKPLLVWRAAQPNAPADGLRPPLS